MTSERRYDIDWLRVIAIGLLLIYHIAIIFQPWAMFIGFIRSDELMEGLWKPMTMLNVWRIPLLFYVSGMGVYFAFRKRNVVQLLLDRAKRILLPYIFGLLAIVPLHLYVFQQYYNLPMSYIPHPGHLWFLGNIVIYVSILFPLFTYLKKKGESNFKEVLSSFFGNPLGLLSISAFFVAEVVIVKPQVFSMYAQSLHGYFIGFLAFLFGFLFAYCGQAFWQTVLKWKWLYIGLGAVLFTIRLGVFDIASPDYLMAIESNCWIFGVFGLGYKYLNRPSSILVYLSKAAYPVYIIHMFALYLGAMIILPLGIPVMLKFVLIVFFTGVVCYLIYEFIIRRVSFLRLLFGMKFNMEKEKSTNIFQQLPGQ